MKIHIEGWRKAVPMIAAVVLALFVSGCTPEGMKKFKSGAEKAKAAVEAVKTLKDVHETKDVGRLRDLDLSSFSGDPDEEQHAEWQAQYNENEEALKTYCFTSPNRDLCERATYVKGQLADALQCMDRRLDEKRACERRKQQTPGYTCDAPRTCYLGR